MWRWRVVWLEKGGGGGGAVEVSCGMTYLSLYCNSRTKVTLHVHEVTA